MAWRNVNNQTTRPVEIHSVNYIDTAGTVTEVRYDRGEKYEGGENDSLTWVDTVGCPEILRARWVQRMSIHIGCITTWIRGRSLRRATSHGVRIST